MRMPSLFRHRGLTLALFSLLLILGDGLRDPQRQVVSRVLLFGIDCYQATLSGRMGVHCRLKPSCSHYGEGALATWGLYGGSFLTLRRLLRCGPWTPSGTDDPVPPRNPQGESA